MRKHSSLISILLICLFTFSCSQSENLNALNGAQENSTNSELISLLSGFENRTTVFPKTLSESKWLFIGILENRALIELPESSFYLTFNSIEEKPWPCDRQRDCAQIIVPFTLAKVKTTCQTIDLSTSFMEVFANEHPDSNYQIISFAAKNPPAKTCKRLGDLRAENFILTMKSTEAAAFIWSHYLFIETTKATWIFKKVQ